MLTVTCLAKICHEANRAYCQVHGDHSQFAWEDSPNWQQQSAIKGVEFRLANPAAPISAQHEAWLAEKRADGWRYGPSKIPQAKVHPCCVPYAELPDEQRAKDVLFVAIVNALKDCLG